MQILRKPIQII